MKSSEYILRTEREYALYIVRNRAIPYVGDGLKHGQRISLWVLKNRTDKIKTFALGGLLAYEKLYVHGDTSANNTINLLAAPYKNNNCMIEGHGQFGNRVAPDKDGIGAPRYTDVKRSKVAEAILYNDPDLIPLESNYDHSNVQPVHFLPLIPTVLLNGIEGIAVGWSTNILPHNLKDLIEATKAALMGKPIPKLVPYYARYNISVRATDKFNQWELSGKVEIIGKNTNRGSVKIIELPPGLSLLKFKEYLIALEDNDLIDGYTDRSSDAIDITVDFKSKREEIINNKTGEITFGKFIPFKMTEDDALDFFKLREKITERIIVLDWCGTRIRVFENPEDVVKEFAQWRLGWFTNRYKRLIADDNQELIFWKAIVVLYAKKFSQKLGTHLNKTEMETEISDILSKAKLVVNDAHINRIVGLSTYRWTKDFETEAAEKVQALISKITDNTKTLNSPAALKQVYLDELNAIDPKKLSA